MKSSILLFTTFLVAVLALPCHAQLESDILKLDDSKHYYYDSVFHADGKSKAELFKAFKGWIVKNVKGQAVANYFDETDHSSVSTNPFITVKGGAVVDFKVNVEIKDGRYKISMNSFIFHQNYTGQTTNFGSYPGLYAHGMKKTILHQVEDAVMAIVQGLDAVSHSRSTTNSDW